jgi:hypothetical protein
VRELVGVVMIVMRFEGGLVGVAACRIRRSASWADVFTRELRGGLPAWVPPELEPELLPAAGAVRCAPPETQRLVPPPVERTAALGRRVAAARADADEDDDPDDPPASGDVLPPEGVPDELPDGLPDEPPVELPEELPEELAPPELPEPCCPCTCSITR